MLPYIVQGTFCEKEPPIPQQTEKGSQRQLLRSPIMNPDGFRQNPCMLRCIDLWGATPCFETRTRIPSPTSSGVGGRNSEGHMGNIALGQDPMSVTKAPQIGNDLITTKFKKLPQGIDCLSGFDMLELGDTQTLTDGFVEKKVVITGITEFLKVNRMPCTCKDSRVVIITNSL